MTDKSFNEQAALLIENALDLIKQVLVKHSAAVLEEMHDQIVARNDEIKQLQIALRIKTEEHDCCTEDVIHLRKEIDALHGDKDAYCEILRVLGMEEEGDPVVEVLRLVKIEKILRDEVNDLNLRIGRMLKNGP